MYSIMFCITEGVFIKYTRETRNVYYSVCILAEGFHVR